MLAGGKSESFHVDVFPTEKNGVDCVLNWGSQRVGRKSTTRCLTRMIIAADLLDIDKMDSDQQANQKTLVYNAYAGEHGLANNATGPSR